MTPLEAAQDWLDRGFLPIPVPFRQKAAVLDGWQKLRLNSGDLPRYFNSAPQNMGILLGDASGTADVDCDYVEAIAAAAELAPATGMRFGRKSKGASHFIYRSNPAARSRKFVDPKNKGTIVELRCQKADGSIGFQTVVPPSIHPSGEQIRFEPGGNGPPSQIEAAKLTEAVAKIAAAALLTRYWPKEGCRHDAFLASAGVFARAGWIVEDAIAIHRSIYRGLWGQAADFVACRKEVESTFQKHTAGAEVTGLQTIAGLVDRVVIRTALDWLGITRNSTAAQVVEWPPIIPLPVCDVTPFTPELFPGFLGEMVGAVSRATETPIELPGMFGLAVAAACVARKVTVSPESGYEAPLNIYAAVSMESGNRKTAVLQHMARPLIDWEHGEAERLSPERKRIVSERKTQQAQVEEFRKKAAKSPNDELLKERIAELEAALPDIPPVPRIWVQDVTPERLGVIMAEQEERIALLSDEGGIFDILAGLYTKGIPNLDLFLQAHSGSPVRVDRGSRPPVLMRHPALTVAISPQPNVLQNLSERPSFRGRGLLARFLCALPPSPLGRRSLEPHSIPRHVEDEYSNGIRRLLKIRPFASDGEGGMWKLRFSPNAYAIWKDFQRSIEALMQEGSCIT